MYARDTALIATPIGMVRVTGSRHAIDRVEIIAGESDAERCPTDGAIALAACQLRDWLAGARRDFALPLAPSATSRGTALRAAMVAIPYGETVSYGALATGIGSSARAIGQACARNPFPIVVPCHRVLDAAGTLGAYSAGAGPATKSWLLEHERRYAGRTVL